MEAVQVERRKLRSRNLKRSIELLFESVRETFELRVLTIADESGLMIIGAGAASECDAVSAYAPLLGEAKSRRVHGQIVETLAPFVDRPFTGEVSVRSFEAQGDQLYLCVVAESGAVDASGVFRSISGVRRILAQNGKESLKV